MTKKISGIFHLKTNLVEFSGKSFTLSGTQTIGNFPVLYDWGKEFQNFAGREQTLCNRFPGGCKKNG